MLINRNMNCEEIHNYRVHKDFISNRLVLVQLRAFESSRQKNTFRMDSIVKILLNCLNSLYKICFLGFLIIFLRRERQPW